MTEINERAAYQARKMRAFVASGGTISVMVEDDLVKDILAQNGGKMKKEEITDSMIKRNPYLDSNNIALASDLVGESLSKLVKKGLVNHPSHGMYEIANR